MIADCSRVPFVTGEMSSTLMTQVSRSSSFHKFPSLKRRFRNRTLWKCCSGYCVDLLNKLATDIGFTYTLYKVRDEKWGLKTENGWNGLIADLMHNKADMCVTSLKVIRPPPLIPNIFIQLNSERARDIDFSLPFLDTGISIIVKIRSGVLSPTAFLEPFEYSTWVIILFVCIHVAAISIFIFEWVSPYSFNMKKYPPPEHKFSLFRSYWLVWATLFSASVSTGNAMIFSGFHFFPRRSQIHRIPSDGFSLGGIWTNIPGCVHCESGSIYDYSGSVLRLERNTRSDGWLQQLRL